MKKLIYSIFKKLGLRVTTYKSSHNQQIEINNLKTNSSKLEFLIRNFKNDEALFLLDNIDSSKSQINQDLFVLNQLNMKKNGYFVEIGAANGVYLSNTFILEKIFNWDGILVEPAKSWHKELKEIRKCNLDFRCVLDDRKTSVNFTEVKSPEYSTIDVFKSKDLHKNIRTNKISEYKVETVSLTQLLEDHNSPTNIDYLSIDTEGSEYEILKNFNFSKYDIKCMTIEHNNTGNKELIDHTILRNGFKKVFEEFSQFENWYIKI